jgi:hypothetical protein
LVFRTTVQQPRQTAADPQNEDGQQHDDDNYPDRTWRFARTSIPQRRALPGQIVTAAIPPRPMLTLGRWASADPKVITFGLVPPIRLPTL